MDYSAVVIPVTKADKAIDKPDPDYKPLNDLDAKNWDACEYFFLVGALERKG
jgi:amidase